MPTVLDVSAIPRGERSRTRKLRDAFLAGYRAKHPDLVHVPVDLAAHHDQLPAFDEWDIQAKFEMAFGEGKLDAVAAARWEALVQLTDQLHAADVVVVSAPMWNFSIPWMLKRWLDGVVQPRLTFEFKNNAYEGLLKGRRAVILTTRDGDFRKSSPFAAYDYQMPYLTHVLGFMGLSPIDTVVAEPLLAAGREVSEAALAKAIAESEALGRSM